MNIAICIIARKKSSRLPDKVVRELQGKKLIQYIIDKICYSKISNVVPVLCTTESSQDDELIKIANRNKIDYVRGSETEVVDRLTLACQKTNADIAVRVTGDNIFTDVILMDELINQHIQHNAEYSRFFNLPNGVTTEVINFSTLIECYKKYDKKSSEYMTLHLFNPDEFRVLNILAEKSLGKSMINLSVDTKEDLERSNKIISYVNHYNLLEIINFIENNNLDNSYFVKNSRIKLLNKTVSFGEYKSLQETLLSKSLKLELESGYYEQKYAIYFT